ncbi:MAG TPA: formate/nitrite transporter family protein [Bryobacteraceae bacterium]|jgi:formate/nitrite transporter FocA (FNT family)|nr:formate/nitrite transporter family protein [Bryobacteraceae bacterium]
MLIENNEHGGEPEPDLVTPELTERQKEEAEDRTSVSALVVHEAIRHDGEEELRRPASALAWSALAAGMSMGFSFIGQALLYAYLPDTPWRRLLVTLGYPIGFLIVIIGRQQLFTENTLTAIIPLLTRRSWTAVLEVARLWAIVLVFNLIGAHLFAWIIGNTPMFDRPIRAAMLALAQHAASVSFGEAVIRGIFAGWLIAMVVWMLAAADADRLAIISILTYIVGLAGLTHIIAGATEVLFLPMVGAKSWMAVAWGYLLPTLIGNTIGGASLTAALNHAQVVAGMNSRKRLSMIATA